MPSTTTHRPPAQLTISAIVVASWAVGLVAAAAVVAAPFLQPTETTLTGGVLPAFAAGWALLAVPSVRHSDQPQRWAAAPAVFFGLTGAWLITGPSPFLLPGSG